MKSIPPFVTTEGRYPLLLRSSVSRSFVPTTREFSKPRKPFVKRDSIAPNGGSREQRGPPFRTAVLTTNAGPSRRDRGADFNQALG